MTAVSDVTLDSMRLPKVPGKFPGAIVLRKLSNGEYATHLRVEPSNREPYYVDGNYFPDVESKEAWADFYRRCKRGF